MDVQAFYNALAHVIGEKTNTEIKVKEIKDGIRNSYNHTGRVQGANKKVA